MTGAGLTYGMSLHVYLKDKNGQPISGNACDNCVAGDGTFDVVARYTEGKINDLPAFKDFLRKYQMAASAVAHVGR